MDSVRVSRLAHEGTAILNIKFVRRPGGLSGVADDEYQIVDRTTKDIRLAEGEMLVTRLWSWSIDRLKKDAEDEWKKANATGESLPYLSISTFGMRRQAGEEIDALTDRLIAHVKTKRSARQYCLIGEPELVSNGFELIPSGPHEHHYDVPLGEKEIDMDKVRRLSALFGTEKIRMPK